MRSAAAERRVEISTEDYLHGSKRYFDETEGMTVVKLFSGDCYVARGAGEMLTTILGSCISACIRDPYAGVGGMNHFLLPGSGDSSQLSEGTRYGVFAMESLINGILKQGGRKERLEIKVFGGGNVLQYAGRIGSMNAAFVREFLRKEGLPIAMEDLGGELPRRVHYYPDTGKVMMRRLKRREDLAVVEAENLYRRSLTNRPIEGQVELF
ncbi:MAG: chemoreceptor glutamine deamidase CheD [Alphaproteobacteria bacterium]|nr:chemoreceptor glutamine deamidase CheD [Alphaproteobacteria bacterium]